MSFFIFIFIVFTSAISILFFMNLRRKKHRMALIQAPFPDAWDNILLAYFPLYKHLPQLIKLQLQGHIRVFMDEKSFEGAGGLAMSDEIRLIISAQACILLLNRKTDYYPKLKTIIVYPTNYVSESGMVCGGESWTFGPVVLSWDAVTHGVSDMQDGRNVVYHEFAHQLDQEDGVGDGTPILENRSAYKTWTHIFSNEFKHHINRVFNNKKTVLRTYGTVHPAEFFAVAVEAFFEKPQNMKYSHPELYDEMKSFFLVDPAEWFNN